MDAQPSPHTVLILGHRWPEPVSSAAGSRMMQLIDCFQRQGWEVVFASAAQRSAFAANIEARGGRSEAVRMNHTSFDDFVRALRPGVVVFDRFMTEEQFGWRVARHCPGALRILDMEDLHCLRQAREAALKHGRPFTWGDLHSDVAKRELAAIWRSDLSLVISGYEMELLRAHFKVDPGLLLYLPFMLDPLTGADEGNWKAFDQRKHFVTIGNFLHAPNLDAVHYLREKVWPLIRAQLPAAELHVFGAYPPPKVEQMNDPTSGFRLHGRATDAREAVGSARVLLAPLRFGAGLKGKLIEAMQCGTPSVTTSTGAEAMHGNLPWPGAVEDEPEAFAGAAVRLYRDRHRWREAQEAGREIVNTLFSKEQWEASLVQRIREVHASLEAHRQSNFIGSMLLHHTMRSTEFMARWIEEKER